MMLAPVFPFEEERVLDDNERHPSDAVSAAGRLGIDKLDLAQE